MRIVELKIVRIQTKIVLVELNRSFMHLFYAEAISKGCQVVEAFDSVCWRPEIESKQNQYLNRD